VRARAADANGEASSWADPVTVKIAAGGDVLLEDFENLQTVLTAAGNGAQVGLEPVPGRAGQGCRITYAGGGSNAAYWDVGKRAAAVNGGDWRAYFAVRVAVRAAEPRQLTVRLVERGVKNPELEGEYWIRQFKPTSEWAEYTFPFTEFTSNVSWQPDDADKNKRMDLDRVLELQFAMDSPAATGAFEADELTLLAGPSGLPSPVPTAAKPGKKKRK
jgi:hypothetical protein